jgi:hypothetical protein
VTLPLFPPEQSLSVWDTSAIIALRENNINRRDRNRILRRLSERVEEGLLLFPREVVGELARYTRPTGSRVEDELLEWARSCESIACSVAFPLETVRAVLARVPSLVDPDAHHDEADPYVLSLALELRNTGFEVVIVTEDRRDNPSKMSLSSASGVFRLPSLPLVPFLRDEGMLTNA